MTDRDVEELRAELARVEQAYLDLTGMLALAKAEAWLDPDEEDQKRIRDLVARRDALVAQLAGAGQPLSERGGAAAPSHEPEALSFYTLGLPDFTETSVTWEDGRLTVHRQAGRDEREVEVTPRPEEWGRFWSALDASGAWQWAADHEGGGLDGVEWSFEVARGGKRLTCRGRNAWPAGFDTVVAALDRLAAGEVLKPFRARPASPVESQVAYWDLLLFDEGAAALPRVIRELREHGGDPSRLVGAAHAVGRLGIAGLPALPGVLEAPGVLGSPPAQLLSALTEMCRAAATSDRAELRRWLEPALPAARAALQHPQCHPEIRETMLTLLRYAGGDDPGASGSSPAR